MGGKFPLMGGKLGGFGGLHAMGVYWGGGAEMGGSLGTMSWTDMLDKVSLDTDNWVTVL